MGFAPTWLCQVSPPPASHEHFNHWYHWVEVGQDEQKSVSRGVCEFAGKTEVLHWSVVSRLSVRQQLIATWQRRPTCITHVRSLLMHVLDMSAQTVSCPCHVTTLTAWIRSVHCTQRNIITSAANTLLTCVKINRHKPQPQLMRFWDIALVYYTLKPGLGSLRVTGTNSNRFASYDVP